MRLKDEGKFRLDRIFYPMFGSDWRFDSGFTNSGSSSRHVSMRERFADIALASDGFHRPFDQSDLKAQNIVRQ